MLLWTGHDNDMLHELLRLFVECDKFGGLRLDGNNFNGRVQTPAIRFKLFDWRKARRHK